MPRAEAASTSAVTACRLSHCISCRGAFSCGVLIAAVCLFLIPPMGEIASSAISIVSELLVLCGALLGIKTSFDVRMQRFESEIEDTRRRMEENEE